ncbi:MAG TPA: hypothetical protein VGE98_16650 [Thermoanaerobaculia bacterium]
MRLRAVLFCLLLILLCIIYVGYRYQVSRAEQEIAQLLGGSQPAFGTQGKSAPKECQGLQVVGWFDRRLVRSGDSLMTWLAIQNDAPGALTDLKISAFHHPGLVATGHCWAGNAPACQPGDVATGSRTGLPPQLGPGDGTTVLAELKPAGPAEQMEIRSTVTWKSAGKDCRAELTIRPNGVPSPSLLRFAAAIYPLAKDLALPVLLGLLAISFQSYLQSQAKTQTVRQALTPRATETALKALGPVISSVRLLSSLAKAKERPSEAFYYFVVILKRWRDLTLVYGGLVLNDRESEVFLTRCWGIFLGYAKRKYGYKTLSFAMDILTDHESISAFYSAIPPLASAAATRREKAEALHSLQASFAKALREESAAEMHLPVLDLMAGVLQTEINFLHLGWYQRIAPPAPAEIEALRQAIADLQIGADDKRALLEDFYDYETVLLRRRGLQGWGALTVRWLAHRNPP